MGTGSFLSTGKFWGDLSSCEPLPQTCLDLKAFLASSTILAESGTSVRQTAPGKQKEPWSPSQSLMLDSHSYIPTMMPLPLQDGTTADHDDADSNY